MPDAEDVVRPYACLPYTWDEPSAAGRPQRLMLAMPGRPRLLAVELDQVGLNRWLLWPVVDTGF